MHEQEEKKERKIYIKATNQWVTVTKEVFDEYYRDINLFRQKQQRNKLCRCPIEKFWLCNEDCLTCEFKLFHDDVSLDANLIDEDADLTLADTLFDDSPLPETIALDNVFWSDLCEKIAKEIPQSDLIISNLMKGLSKKESAEIAGISLATHRRRIEKIKAYIRKILENDLKE